MWIVRAYGEHADGATRLQFARRYFIEFALVPGAIPSERQTALKRTERLTLARSFRP